MPLPIVDTDYQDADDAKCIFAVPCHSHLLTAHIGDVQAAAFFSSAFDEPDSGLCIASKQGDEALHLLLRIADKTGTNLIVRRLRKRNRVPLP